MKYSSVKLIAHSDVDDGKKVYKSLLEMGFSNYFLVDSDIINFKLALDKTVKN